jgi:hypothetical protein
VASPAATGSSRPEPFPPGKLLPRHAIPQSKAVCPILGVADIGFNPEQESTLCPESRNRHKRRTFALLRDALVCRVAAWATEPLMLAVKVAMMSRPVCILTGEREGSELRQRTQPYPFRTTRVIPAGQNMIPRSRIFASATVGESHVPAVLTRGLTPKGAHTHTTPAKAYRGINKDSQRFGYLPAHEAIPLAMPLVLFRGGWG